MGVYDDYIDYDTEYKEKYGDTTVVLMEVGSFFEVYGIENSNETKGANVKEIAEILGIQFTKKNKNLGEVSRKNPYLAGFPNHALQKFINILLENNFTIVLVEQVTPSPYPKRKVTEIISPSTYIENIPTYETNQLMCLYFTEEECWRRHGTQLCIGVSGIDLSTGKSFSVEYLSDVDDQKYALDEVYRLLKSNSPKELVLLGNNLSVSENDIISYLELGNYYYHNKITTFPKEYTDFNYQNNILRQIFKKTGTLTPIEYIDMEKHLYALVSYTFLLQFAYEHNENILSQIDQPEILEDHDHLILSYNSINQLNLVPTGPSTGFLRKRNTKFSSLLGILNNCHTPQGRRLFKERLLNPIKNVEVLEQRYDLTDWFMESKQISETTRERKYTFFSQHLNKIFDLERMVRKVSLGIYNPCDFISLDASLIATTHIVDILEQCSFDFGLIGLVGGIKEKIIDTQDFYTGYLDLDLVKHYHLNNITNSFFNEGICEEVDDYQRLINSGEKFFADVCTGINNMKPEFNNFLRYEYSEKDGYYFLITQRRWDTVQKIFDGYSFEVQEPEINKDTRSPKKQSKKKSKKKKSSKVEIYLSDFTDKKVSSSSSNLKVFHILNDQITTKVVSIREKMKKIVREKYLEFLQEFHQKYQTLFTVINTLISEVDFYSNNAYNSVRYRYYRPTIDKDSRQSYIDAKSMRHPIIEIIQTDIEYVSNDVRLGFNDQIGMLLFGINSSGKSSLMKSIGLNLIMAQSGMYVASKEFVYFPYKYLFTRISGNDNLFKGQSTFAVEMSELRNIMKRSDNSSLILGDELCSGTESISAISLVAAGIITLSQKKSSFIFATHLHDLSKMKQIETLQNVNIYHLSVKYDHETKLLEYDRIIKKGSGQSIYGLEVCKSLDLDKNFLNLANDIRKDVLGIKKNIVDYVKSHYNSQVYLNNCEICGNKADEVHHIKFQKDADSEGYITHFHKNSKFNLVALCNNCHNNVHHGKLDIYGYKLTTDGIELQHSN